MDENKKCPQCGQIVEEKDKFCINCGFSLMTDSTSKAEKSSKEEHNSSQESVKDVAHDIDISNKIQESGIEIENVKKNEQIEGNINIGNVSPPPVSNVETQDEKLSEDEIQETIDILNGKETINSEENGEYNTVGMGSNWIYCSVCGKKLSKDAHTCPNCGHPIKSLQTANTSSGGGGLSFGGVVMAVLFAAFLIWLG